MTKGDKSETRGHIHFGKHARNSIGLVLFIIFLTAGVSNGRWENTYVFYWNQFGEYNFGTWMHLDLKTGDEDQYGHSPDTDIPQPQPFIHSMGEDLEGYPMVFFHETFEQNIISLTNVSREDPFQALNQYSRTNLEKYFYNYGKSAAGVYSVGNLPKSDRPGFLWIDDDIYKEVQSWCVIPDISSDGVNDILITYKQLLPFPAFGDNSEFATPSDFFLPTTGTEGQFNIRSDRLKQFYECVIIPNDWSNGGNEAIMIPKPQLFRTQIVSGDGFFGDENQPDVLTTKKVILFEGETLYGNDNILQTVFTMNNTDPKTNATGTVSMLISNLQKPAYYKENLWKTTDPLSHKIATFNLQGNKLWEIDLRIAEGLTHTMNISKFPHVSSNEIVTFDVRQTRTPVKLQSLDNGLLALTFYTSIAHYGPNLQNELWLPWEIPINIIINTQTGQKMWGSCGELVFDDRLWFEKEQFMNNEWQDSAIPHNKEVFVVNLLDYQSAPHYVLEIQMHNSLNGGLISRYNHVVGELFQYQDLKYDFIVAADYQNQTSNLPEIIACGFHNTNQGRESFYFRLNMAPTNTQIIGDSIPGFDIFNEGNFQGNLGELQLYRTGVDFDRDQITDYIILIGNTPIILSGMGSTMYKREYLQRLEEIDFGSPTFYENKKVSDFRSFDKLALFFEDPIEPLRISSIISQVGYLYYFEDVNSYRPNLTFIEYFPTLGLIFYIAVAIISALAVLMLLKDTKKLPEKPVDRVPQLTRVLKVGILITAAIYIMIFTYFMDIGLQPRTTDIFISEMTSIYWFFIVYPIVFLLIALIPTLYNKIAPKYADLVYLRFQKRVFDIYVKRGFKDYKVLIMHMEERKKVDRNSYLNRSLLPLLMGLTIGIGIYNGLAEGGALLGMLRIFSPNSPALTNPANLGIWHVGEASIDEIWVEMGKYARYMVLGMFIAFILTSVIIAPAWLLDDAGVVFYVRCKNIRSINDVDSVSEWFLNFVTGVFGITTIISWASLFLPMLENLDTLSIGLAKIENFNPVYSVIIIILALIVFPIITTVTIMSAANQKMEQKLVSNSSKLFKRMMEGGFDVVPKRIEAILDAKDSEHPGPWTNYFDIHGNPITTQTEQGGVVNE